MDGLEGQNKGFVLDTGVQWQAEFCIGMQGSICVRVEGQRGKGCSNESRRLLEHELGVAKGKGSMIQQQGNEGEGVIKDQRSMAIWKYCMM